MACKQQQYNCLCRPKKENLQQKCLLLKKNCSSSTPEVYNPWWNSPEPYLPLAFSNEDAHPASQILGAEGVQQQICLLHNICLSPKLQSWVCKHSDSVGKVVYRRKSEVSITTTKLWFHCEVNDDISEIYICDSEWFWLSWMYGLGGFGWLVGFAFFPPKVFFS